MKLSYRIKSWYQIWCIVNSSSKNRVNRKHHRKGRAMSCVWLTEITLSIWIVHKNRELVWYCVTPTKHTFWEILGEGEVIFFISSFIKSRNCTFSWYWGFLKCFMKKVHQCLKRRNKHISNIYATISNLVLPRIKNTNMPFLPTGKEK
jgi:hypothetical protein